MKVSDVLTRRAAAADGSVSSGAVTAQILDYLDELQARGFIPMPALKLSDTQPRGPLQLEPAACPRCAGIESDPHSEGCRHK